MKNARAGGGGVSQGWKYVNLPKSKEFPFSDGVLAGETMYLSGRIGLDPKTKWAAEDVEQEARLMLEGFRKVLGKAKMTMDDLVYVTVYCTDLSLFSRFNAIYRTYFRGEFPARAFLGAGSLVLGARFEIQGIAIRRSTAAKAARTKGTR
ncbi:MAG: RidA family protein [Acidobacteriia bacterium]|nr:RidA family protein [Terriglobia bacterium]